MNRGRYVRDPHVLARPTLDAIVVLAVHAEEAVVVGDVGPEVWSLLREPRAIDDLAERGGSDGDRRRAVEQAVAQLLEAGAIRVVV